MAQDRFAAAPHRARYKTVDHRIVWGIVEQRLDELEVAARRMLAARGE